MLHAAADAFKQTGEKPRQIRLAIVERGYEGERSSSTRSGHTGRNLRFCSAVRFASRSRLTHEASGEELGIGDARLILRLVERSCGHQADEFLGSRVDQVGDPQ